MSMKIPSILITKVGPVSFRKIIVPTKKPYCVCTPCEEQRFTTAEEAEKFMAYCTWVFTP